MNRLALVLPLIALLLAACSADELAAPSPTIAPGFATVTSTPPPTATPTPGPQQILEGRILDAFASLFGSGRELMRLESLEEIDWPDSCLGVVRPNALCAAVVVPGYRAVIGFERETISWEIHTDESLDRIVWIAGQEAEGTIASIDGDAWVIAGDSDLFADTINPGEINVSVLPGTDFRTPVSDLGLGRPVAFGIAGQPSSDVTALVWIEAR